MGKLTPSTWEEAFELIGKTFSEVRDKDGGAAIGVIGSNRTTNEENYLLQKFARVVLKTNNIDHHRTADFPALAAALAESLEATATMRDVFTAPAILLIGNDPTSSIHCWPGRFATTCACTGRGSTCELQAIKLARQATSFTQIPPGSEGRSPHFWRAMSLRLH
jgi:NADH-quinone oxidoreductase subunit G